MAGLFKIRTGRPNPSIAIPITINGTHNPMELDTGATVSAISEDTWNGNFFAIPLERALLKLKT